MCSPLSEPARGGEELALHIETEALAIGPTGLNGVVAGVAGAGLYGEFGISAVWFSAAFSRAASSAVTTLGMSGFGAGFVTLSASSAVSLLSSS